MKKSSNKEVLSYILGFEISVALTLIPYALVAYHFIAGTALLFTILGFAMLQMLVQVYFFLHLGRGPKPWYNITFFVFTVGTILLVVVGSLFIMSHLHHYMTPTETAKQLAESEAIHQTEGHETGACHGFKANHQVIIANGKVSPSSVDAQLCDTLTFLNQDSRTREIAFGSHPAHDEYGGELEVVLRTGVNKTIVLNEAGSYIFHDHLEPTVTGGFVVDN